MTDLLPNQKKEFFSQEIIYYESDNKQISLFLLFYQMVEKLILLKSYKYSFDIVGYGKIRWETF